MYLCDGGINPYHAQIAVNGISSNNKCPLCETIDELKIAEETSNNRYKKIRELSNIISELKSKRR